MSQPLGYDKNLSIPCHVVDRNMISSIIGRAISGKNTYIKCCSTSEAADMYHRFVNHPSMRDFNGVEVILSPQRLVIEFHIGGCGFIKFQSDPDLRGNTAENFYIDEMPLKKKNILVNEETIYQAGDVAIEEAINHAVYGSNVFVKCRHHTQKIRMCRIFKNHPLIEDLIHGGIEVRFSGLPNIIEINGSRIVFFVDEQQIRGIRFDIGDEPSIDKYNTFAVMSEAISGHWTNNNPTPFIPIKEEAPKKESNPIREAMIRWEAKHGKEV